MGRLRDLGGVPALGPRVALSFSAKISVVRHFCRGCSKSLVARSRNVKETIIQHIDILESLVEAKLVMDGDRERSETSYRGFYQVRNATGNKGRGIVGCGGR